MITICIDCFESVDTDYDKGYYDAAGYFHCEKCAPEQVAHYEEYGEEE